MRLEELVTSVAETMAKAGLLLLVSFKKPLKL